MKALKHGLKLEMVNSAHYLYILENGKRMKLILG